MTRDTLIETLRQLPSRLEQAEATVLLCEWSLEQQRAALVKQEDRLLLEGAIDGKNEATRAAQLREATADLREAVIYDERDLAKARSTLRIVQAEFSAARSIARLMAGDER